jgi:hypothetical protein
VINGTGTQDNGYGRDTVFSEGKEGAERYRESASFDCFHACMSHRWSQPRRLAAQQASSILNRDLFPFLFELRDCFPSLMRKKKEATYLLSKLSIP